MRIANQALTRLDAWPPAARLGVRRGWPGWKLGLWDFGKVRYLGLVKNAIRAFTALALANIYLGRQRLMAQVRP